MATYYHGAPEIQPDGLQTLYLMNPGYAGYPDAAAEPGNMVLLNSAMIPTAYSHNSQSSNTQHLVGIPLHHSLPPDANHPYPSSIGLGHRLHYNQWTPGPSNSNSIGMASPSQPSPHRPASTHQQGLYLSLSPQHRNLYTSYRPEPDMPVTGAPEAKVMSSNRNSGLQSFLIGSKFLKATQELLDEVASVGKGSHIGVPAKATPETKSPAKSSRESEGAGEADMSGKRAAADLTTAERQELQMKKAKLVNTLDEVEQRYRQYRQQMQIVVSSFESVSGFGSARTYTSLALQTISKQFRCLRDSISGQIRSTSRSLREEDCSAGGSKSTGSRLRFVDHHLRQQRALQQLGMIQHNAWRPQRGLPEQAVSVLRAWLFEHFLHPYPKDADKIMLAKQTGLTRSQVSNWFINARVRLWKPMVEEMYTEEFKEQELSNADEKASKSDAKEDSASKSNAHQDRSPTRTEQTDMTLPQSVLGTADNHDVVMPPSLKKSRNDQPISAEMKPEEMSNREVLMKFMDGRSSGDYNYMEGAADHLGGFGSYSIGEIGRFGHEQFAPRFSGNGVSLTLGLPHADNLSLSGTQASYLSGESMPLERRIEMNSTEPSDYCSHGNNPTPAHPPNAYGSISIQDRKRYATQLLPDFVA